MAELSAWDQITGGLTDGLTKVFSEGLPKYVDAEVGVPYEVNQPTRQYEQAPNGQTQRAGLVNNQPGITSNPWLIGGLIVAGVVYLASQK